MKKLLAASLCIVVLGLCGPINAARASTTVHAGSDEGSFVGKINALRASKGVRTLQVTGELTSIARTWSSHMAAAGGISHNPNLASQVSGGWHSLGENVGVGYDVDSLWAAFVASPEHYANLVDPDFNYIGVGDVWAADGRLFTTHDFEQLGSGGSPPPTSPPPTVGPGGSTQPGNSGHQSSGSTHTAPGPTPPPPPPPPPAAPERVSTVLVALHALQP